MWVTLERTCFATSLDRLVRLSGPARSLSGSSKQLEEDVTLNAPQEVMRLINWLMGNATEVVSEHIFYAVWMLMCIPLDKIVLVTWRSDFSGTDSRGTLITTITIIYSPGGCLLLLQCLDTGADFDLPTEEDLERSALSVATCLIELLSSLPEPLIPFTMQQRCAQATNRDDAFEVRYRTIFLSLSFTSDAQLLDSLPSPSVNVCGDSEGTFYFIFRRTLINHY